MEFFICNNSSEIRIRFISYFVMPYNLCKKRYNERFKDKRYEYTFKKYREDFMWCRFPDDAIEMCFEHAIDFLSKKSSNVFFMSEDVGNGSMNYCEFEQGNNNRGRVASVNAKDLAYTIKHEWKLKSTEETYFQQEYILPDDLYVFDDSFLWCIVFTHENYIDSVSDSRICFYIYEN